MSRTLKIVIVAALLPAFVVIWLLFLKKGKYDVLYKVPNTSTSVMIIDVRALSSKLFLDDIGRDIKSRSRIAQFIPDSLKNIDWTATGLGLPDKIALFTTEDTATTQPNIHFIIPISNAGKFHNFMDSLGAKMHFVVSKKGGIEWVYNKNIGFLVAWDKHFVTGIKITGDIDKQLDGLVRILATPREQSVMADTCFAKKAIVKYDILLYSKPYQRCPVKKLEAINSNIHYITSCFNFNDGELEINAEVNAKKGSHLDKMFAVSDRDLACLANTSSALVNIRINLDPVASRLLYNQLNPFDLKTSNIPCLDAWDGRLNFIFNGTKIIESTFISYEYDNDFNKVEIKKTKHENVLDIQALAGAKQALMDSLWKQTPPIKEEADTLLFKGGRFVLKRNGAFYTVYNKQFIRPLQQTLVTKNNIEIAADYKKLSPILKEIGMESKTNKLDSLTLEKFKFAVYKQDNIHITTNIYFVDKDKNAFFSLIENGLSFIK